jgi:hypothetical protein
MKIVATPVPVSVSVPGGQRGGGEGEKGRKGEEDHPPSRLSRLPRRSGKRRRNPRKRESDASS